MMKIVAINDEQGFDQLSDSWNQILLAYDEATVHSTFEWLRTWWDHYRGTRKLLILVARQRRSNGGHRPFRRFHLDRGQGAGGPAHPRVARPGILRLRGLHRAPRITIRSWPPSWITCWKYRSSWDRIDLREIREDSPNLKAFQAAAHRCRVDLRIAGKHDLPACGDRHVVGRLLWPGPGQVPVGRPASPGQTRADRPGGTGAACHGRRSALEGVAVGQREALRRKEQAGPDARIWTFSSRLPTAWVPRGGWTYLF